MADRSSIEWTDATWNPVTGCTKVSPGCAHCYAETFAERFRGVAGHPYEQGFDLKLWPERIEVPLGWKKPRRIFVNSMSDLFHDEVPDAFIERVFDAMMRAKMHTFQVLTKRARRMAAFLDRHSSWRLARDHPHIWLGTSVENQDCFRRAEVLAEVRAGLRFLSCEPLLGPLDLTAVLDDIDWVIAGGESGPKARPMDPAWVRAIRDQCLATSTPFHFKQWGGTQKWRNGRQLDGRTWDGIPVAARAAR